ncbi:hypothetical protein HDE_08192 [Halotydeus destructor]|nr:hypothetical protein HDE_08192 [Halotydeus destructor]
MMFDASPLNLTSPATGSSYTSDSPPLNCNPDYSNDDEDNMADTTPLDLSTKAMTQSKKVSPLLSKGSSTSSRRKGKAVKLSLYDVE